jgi:hypothetical protein
VNFNKLKRWFLSNNLEGYKMKHLKKTVLTFVVFTSVLSANIINVPADIDSIQGGIDLANDGDTVLVQPGTYLEKKINFNGKNIVVGSLMLTTGDTSYISQTVIDGSGHPYDAVVYFISGEDTTSVLCGFTITGGEHDWEGGGIYLNSSSPILSHLLIKNNYATAPFWLAGLGGGIYCKNSSSRLSDIVINENYAMAGGGLYCDSSNITLSNVKLTNNVNWAHPDGQAGGGIVFNNSNPILFNVEVSGNITSGPGGGINCYNSNPSFSNVTIKNNFSGSFGGGIWFEGSDASLVNVEVISNVSDKGGGIFCRNSNDSADCGGGLYLGIPYSWQGSDSSDIFLSDVTVSNNYASANGGGFFIDPEAGIKLDSVNRCNIYFNSADSNGDDLYTLGDSIISVVVDTFTVLIPDSSHAYPLNKFTFDILHAPVTSISEYPISPKEYSLRQNYPNPFNPTTNIEFSIPKSEFVTLKIYNILGEEVATLVSERLTAGSYKYDWPARSSGGDASSLSSGVYFYKIKAGAFQQINKMILLR